VDPSFQELPGYDAYDPGLPDGVAPSTVYVNGLSLVLAGERVFLVDETNHSDIREEIARLAPGATDLVIRGLSRQEAAIFARYMDWNAVCSAFPDDHPISWMRIPAMPTTELDRDDPGLLHFDLAAVRTAYLAQSDQDSARPSRYNSREPEIPDADLPPSGMS
jgi:hypothetical protein